MNKQEAEKRIEKLKKQINYFRHAYHVLNQSLISDEALDSLKKELFDLEQQFPEFISLDSPTQRVAGKPLKEFKKIRHHFPMLSFNDAFSEKDIKDWFKRIENYLGHQIKEEFYCELKIDGLAIELVYENNILTQGSTRGDGIIGEDIIQNLKTIEAIPLRLEKSEKFSKIIVRGEVFISKKEFERMNREQERKREKLFSNPRNMVAGSVRQLDSKIAASRELGFFAYDVVLPQEKSLKFNNHEQKHIFLKEIGFIEFGAQYNQKASSLKEVFEFKNYWEKNREKLSYEIDGIVVIINDNEVFEKAGVVGKAPRAAIAYKFFPKETTTVIENIKIQIGRTGVLTPVAILKPVEIGGVKIIKATLHNFDQIKKLGLKIGDTVIVSRAGDVIPQITKVLKELRTGKEKNFQLPEFCPIDGSKIIKENIFYRCSNPKCGARNTRIIRHFVSKPAFNIEGLGPKIIDRFLDEGLISDASDIFELKEKEIAALSGFGEKSANNIVEEIKNKKKIHLHRFIYSLGIFHIGEETSRLLAEKFLSEKTTSLDILTFLTFFRNIKSENLRKIRDVGPEDVYKRQYLRGEITQGVHVNFKNILNSSRLKIPFGIAQIGKAFRNEITPGNFTYRSIEFEQMELQYYVKPDEKKSMEYYEFWKNFRMDWYKLLGINSDNLRFREHQKNELAHYAKAAWDIEYKTPFGWKECEGIHHRGDWDLSQHQKFSGQDMSYFDEETKEKYLPWVIETSGGVDRAALFFLIDAYYEEKDPAKNGASRIVLKLNSKLAPYKAAVFPLLANKPELVKRAREIYDDLRKDFMVAWDDRGNIGKRYYSQDEIGTLFCITIDFQTLEDNTVTVRDRDTMKQERIEIKDLSQYLVKKL